MNPYVYSKRTQARVQACPRPSASALIRHVFTSPISTAVAFAAVIFAAGSVASMAAIAAPQIASSSFVPTVLVAQAKAFSEVLGDSTTVPSASIIDDSSLEAGNGVPSVKLSAKAVSYDSTVGRWDYVISYSASGLSGSGSLDIGTYVVSPNLTASSGQVDTGAILKPSMTYYVYFFTGDGSGNQVVAASLKIKTPKGKNSSGDSSLINPCAQNQGQKQGQGGFIQQPSGNSSTSTPPIQPQSGNSTSTMGSMFCLKSKSGNVICPKPPVCGSSPRMPHPLGSSSTTPPQFPGNPSGASSTPPWGGQPPPGGSGAPSGTPFNLPPPRQ